MRAFSLVFIALLTIACEDLKKEHLNYRWVCGCVGGSEATACELWEFCGSTDEAQGMANDPVHPGECACYQVSVCDVDL